MKYDFDQIIDRSANRAAKYDERIQKFGTRDVIPLWVADMDFKTAQPIIDAMKARAEEGIWGYTSRPDSYFDAICSWQERRNGWTIDKSLVSWSLGVVPALSAIVNVFSNPGDKVMIQTPVYSECTMSPKPGDGWWWTISWWSRGDAGPSTLWTLRKRPKK